MDISLGTLQKLTGVSKPKLQGMLERGELRGTRGPRRTDSWMIPEEQVEFVKTLRTRPRVERGNSVGFQKPTAADYGLSDEWVSVTEAGEISGYARDTILNYITAGKMELQIGTRGDRTIKFVRRDQLPTRSGTKLQRTRSMLDEALSAVRQPQVTDQRYTIKEAVGKTGLSSSVFHNAIAGKRLAATKVQTGPKQFAYYINSADLDEFTATHKVRTYAKRAERAPVTTQAEIFDRRVEARPVSDLGEQLRSAAQLVAAGLAEVISFEIALRFKGGE